MIYVFTHVFYSVSHFFCTTIPLNDLPFPKSILELKVGDYVHRFRVGENEKFRWSEKHNSWFVPISLDESNKEMTVSNEFRSYQRSWLRADSEGTPITSDQ